MQLPLCSNAYDNVTDFKICEKHGNLDTRERIVIFSSNKKNSLITHQGPLYGTK